ncbi:unnamed protein product [Cuscuta epithymum]|uniref:K Homology domain-containing protein n=1 Tax=Cuscuta epithymum TaxID=186058 RepID=A0AAV0ETW1_9ASTE|nr:unnamed protein product [Cuscuta epithymum]CAH9126713.1 unnamed protein product [Cuscuta epithymum]
MADKEVVVVATSVPNSDNLKRKLEDLEPAAPGVSVSKEEPRPDLAEKTDSEVKEGALGERDAQDDGSEVKRPRLEEKADEIKKADEMGAENGNTEDKSGESKEYNSIQLDKSPEVDNERTEEKKGDGSKVDDTGEKPAGLDVSLQLDNNISQLDNGPMLDNEAPKTTIDRQQTPIVDDLQTTNIQQSSSTEKELHNTPEVDNEAPKTAISEQLARIDDLQTSNDKKSNNSEKLETHDNSEEQSKSEDQEPPSCVPQHGDALNDQEKILVLDTQSVSHKMEVPNNKVGVLIGKSGETIRHLQYNSGAKIQITRDADSDPHSITRSVTLIGTTESISKAEKLIKDVITEADAGGSPSLVARGFNPVQSVVGDQIELQVPIEKVGLIIGRNGETIKNLQRRSGARIQLVQLSEGEQVKERTVRVSGDRKQIERAREMIQEVMDQIWILLFTSGQHCLLRVAIVNYYSLSSSEERYQALAHTISGCV